MPANLLGEHSLPTNVGVHSLVTLDTPHYGSVGADYVFAVYYSDNEIGFGLFSDTILNIIIRNRVSNEKTFRTQWDLTQYEVQSVFDFRYADPPPTPPVNNEFQRTEHSSSFFRC
jgi:hypothetical protein